MRLQVIGVLVFTSLTLTCVSGKRVSSNMTLVNVALKKRTTQDGSYREKGKEWSASNAVDGQILCDQVDYRHFSATNAAERPWWQVDLGNVYEITQVNVYGRQTVPPEQLRGFELYLFTTPTNGISQLVYTDGSTESQYNNTRGTYEIQIDNVQAQHVKIELPGTYRPKTQTVGALTLCEVKVIAKVPNLLDSIYNIHTNMSAAYSNWTSDKAIDGKYPGKNELPETCHCCSGTGGNWWSLNLGMKFPLQYIQIIGRSDSYNYGQLKEFQLYLSNSTGQRQEYSYTGTGYIFQVTGLNVLAQHIYITKTGFLTLCEVIVIEGDCQLGRFGNECSDYCHCSDEKKCNIKTGECQSPSCKAGFNGTSCNIDCPIGTFAVGCFGECHCNDSKTCDKENGTCKTTGCQPGWQGEACNKDCHLGRFGNECSGYCHCLDEKKCNRKTGECQSPGCKAGFIGTSCNIDCPVGTFTVGCLGECHCNDSNTCDKKNGTCQTPGCQPGWQGEACNKDCHLGRFGNECSGYCQCSDEKKCKRKTGECQSPGCKAGFNGTSCNIDCPIGTFAVGCFSECHCNDSKTCDKENGTCQTSGCQPGWQGIACNKGCEDGYYGINCGNECGHCLNASPCNKENENCTDCAAYTGPISCFPGHYGPHCSFSCSDNCRNKQPCNITDGRCTEGCDRGYAGVLCNITCTDGYFGYNCENRCGNCYENVTCDRITGSCSHGCSAGYMHDNCTTACSSITFGENCKSTCLCINGESCTNDKGVCPGDCLPGYHGISCNKECTDNTYGINCVQKCGFCANNTKCKTYTGACEFGCIPPYIAPLCTEFNVPSTKDTSTGLIIGISAGVSSLFIVAAIVTIIVTLKRRQAKKQNETNYTQPNMYIQPSEISEYDTIQLADVKEVPHVTPYENMNNKINTQS